MAPVTFPNETVGSALDILAEVSVFSSSNGLSSVSGIPKPTLRLEAPEAGQGFGARPSVKLETTCVTSQPELIRPSKIHAESVIAKLREAGRCDLWEPLAECGTKWSIIECAGCGKLTHVSNHCDSRWCAACQPTLTRKRQEGLEWWTKTISQPKHVVLTVRNVNDLTPEYIRWFKDSWGRLRRSQFAKDWRGGIYSLEVTNEGRGWHLHLHALIDADWIDSKELARNWSKLVGQDFSIVKVKDARRGDYLNEVAKYAVKGSDLARWSGEEIAQFVDAFEGSRTFGIFGSCYGKREEWKNHMKELRDRPMTCDCGCSLYRVFSEQEWEWEKIKRENRMPDAPVPNRQPSLGLTVEYATGSRSMPS